MWDELLATQSQRFRKSWRQRRNRLERERDVRYRYADSATLERDLDAVFRLHRARFGEHACNFCGDHEAFQREFAALALERGWLRLLLLEVDGVPVGCKYGFFFQNAYFAYQSGRDPAWERESVGFLLEVESIRRTLEEGADYRFLGGEEHHKYRYPTEDPRLETVAAPASRRGRVGAAALDALWRLPGGKAALRRIASARA
jgi:CelD/BcsL family acetyltransferase involved in cellulose biosynthesis